MHAAPSPEEPAACSSREEVWALEVFRARPRPPGSTTGSTVAAEPSSADGRRSAGLPRRHSSGPNLRGARRRASARAAGDRRLQSRPTASGRLAGSGPPHWAGLPGTRARAKDELLSEPNLSSGGPRSTAPARRRRRSPRRAPPRRRRCLRQRCGAGPAAAGALERRGRLPPSSRPSTSRSTTGTGGGGDRGGGRRCALRARRAASTAARPSRCASAAAAARRRRAHAAAAFDEAESLPKLLPPPWWPTCLCARRRSRPRRRWHRRRRRRWRRHDPGVDAGRRDVAPRHPMSPARSTRRPTALPTSSPPPRLTCSREGAHGAPALRCHLPLLAQAHWSPTRAARRPRRRRARADSAAAPRRLVVGRL